MKKAALFYNPVAGGGRFKNHLDTVINHLQVAGLQVIPWRINDNSDILAGLRSMADESLYTVAGAGGDGTIHGLVNALMESNLQIPVAIFPEGTANDVASHLGIPLLPERYCKVLTSGRLVSIDLGKVNGQYFINVAAAGLLSETAHEVQYRWKNLLGRGAYFLKSLEKFPRMRSLNLRLNADGSKIEMEIMLFLILNGGTAGGFQHLMPESKMNDGNLEFLAIKPVSLPRAAQLIYNFLRRQHLQDDNVFFYQGKHFQVELEPPVATDLDGEKGPALPWDVAICPSAIKLWLPAV